MPGRAGTITLQGKPATTFSLRISDIKKAFSWEKAFISIIYNALFGNYFKFDIHPDVFV